ncbi:MAG: SRPBCC family protein [Candidatus Dormibacteria bacterium]
MTPCSHVQVTGSFPLAFAPDEAFPLFTPSGERSWVDGWDPQFPSLTADETEPGTVFTTAHEPHLTTWVVARHEGCHLIAYANVTPGERAVLITVGLEPTPTGSTVTVTYDVTALAPAANVEVQEFAAGYVEYLDGWRDRIARRGVPALVAGRS